MAGIVERRKAAAASHVDRTLVTDGCSPLGIGGAQIPEGPPHGRAEWDVPVSTRHGREPRIRYDEVMAS